MALNPGDAFDDVLEEDLVAVGAAHSRTASRRARSRMGAYRHRSVTTSTGLSRSRSASMDRPHSARADVPGGASTRRSTSLRPWFSPRAIEPNTRRLHSPRRSASASSAARCSASSGGSVRVAVSGGAFTIGPLYRAGRVECGGERNVAEADGSVWLRPLDWGTATSPHD